MVEDSRDGYQSLEDGATDGLANCKKDYLKQTTQFVVHSSVAREGEGILCQKSYKSKLM